MKKELGKDLFDQKELQTVSKHNIFENYLEPWAKIISNQPWVSNAYYVDAFAGTGRYTKTGEPGSPVIACDILLKYQKQTCRFHCICVEKEPQRYKILEDSLKRFKKRLDVKTHNGEFLSFIDAILHKTENSPTFFFIDPEGFSGMDFTKIEAILSLPHKEVLINFQYNAIQRWLKAPKVKNTITKLFGTSDFKTVKGEGDLIELYKQQLRQRGSYAWSFRNKFTMKNRTFYYLVYATKNLTGFKIMKEVMFSEQSKRYFEPSLFEEVNFQTFQKQIFSKYKSKKFVEYNEVLGSVLQDTNYLDRDLKKVLRNIGVTQTNNKNNRYNPFLSFPDHNSNSLLQKDIPTSKYQNILFETQLQPSKLKISYKQYVKIDDKKETSFSQVNDGSIITRFDKTPLPEKDTDVICPHFVELKWAYGCPFDCSWCYLKGTFRFRPEGIKPVIKDLEKVKLHVQAFLNEVKEPEILNAGELADSLMLENGLNAFSKFIIPLFETQDKHKVLFVTKSSNIKNLLQLNPHNQVIVSFTLNASPVDELWEKKAPRVLDRIKAAEQLYNIGYEIRIRIDPMVPIENWEKNYQVLIDEIFSRFTPERITLGSLRGLQSTINGTKDKSWVHYLKESSNWGKKIDFSTRLKMYSSIITYLRKVYDFQNVALCKETKAMWQKLKMNYKNIRCNCTW